MKDITLSIKGIREGFRYYHLLGYEISDKDFKELWSEIYDREITIP